MAIIEQRARIKAELAEVRGRLSRIDDEIEQAALAAELEGPKSEAVKTRDRLERERDDLHRAEVRKVQAIAALADTEQRERFALARGRQKNAREQAREILARRDAIGEAFVEHLGAMLSAMKHYAAETARARRLVAGDPMARVGEAPLLDLMLGAIIKSGLAGTYFLGGPASRLLPDRWIGEPCNIPIDNAAAVAKLGQWTLDAPVRTASVAPAGLVWAPPATRNPAAGVTGQGMSA